MYEASKALLKEKTIKPGRVKESDLRSEIESETTLHVIRLLHVWYRNLGLFQF